MPLVQGGGQKAISENIRRLSHEIGRSPHIQTRAQAIAIAESVARRARAMGGVVPGYDMGGGIDPQQAPGLTPGMAPPPGVMPPQAPGTAPQGVAGPQMGTPAPPGMNNAPPAAVATPFGLPQGQWASGVAQNAAPPAIPQNAPPMPPNSAPAQQPMGKQLMASGGALQRAGGGFSMAKAPHLDSGWQTRSEARAMHIGPVLSAIPGRVDAHKVKVPSGSYVIPAATISSIGQGNSVAGLSLAHQMFGGGGPYGTGASRITRGPGAPRPRMMKGLADGGAPEEQDYGHPVDVDISGGEYVVGPDVLIRKFGDLDTAHKIMDAWILSNRKKEISTLKQLPPPAKS